MSVIQPLFILDRKESDKNCLLELNHISAKCYVVDILIFS